MQQHMSPHDQYRQPFVARIDGGDAVNGYDWTEVVWDRTEYVEPDSPRTGVASLFGLNGAAAAVNQLVTARFRAVSPEGDPTFVFGDGGNSPQVARVTGVPSAGLYPAVLTSYDQDAATWSDADTVQLLPLNGEALETGQRYLAIPAGGTPADPPVWLAVATCCDTPAEITCTTPAANVYCVAWPGATGGFDELCYPAADGGSVASTVWLCSGQASGYPPNCSWTANGTIPEDCASQNATCMFVTLTLPPTAIPATLSLYAPTASLYGIYGAGAGYVCEDWDDDAGGTFTLDSSQDAHPSRTLNWPATLTVTKGPCLNPDVPDGSGSLGGGTVSGCGASEAVAESYTLTLAGVGNGNCSSCTDLNATHTFTYASGCTWEAASVDPCDGTPAAMQPTLTYVAAGASGTWFINFGVMKYFCEDEFFNALGETEFALYSSGFECTDEPSTVTLVAVP